MPATDDAHDRNRSVLQKLWVRVCTELENSLGASTFERWFSSVTLVRIDDFTWLRAPNEIYSLWIEENYQTELEQALKRHLETCPQVRFEHPEVSEESEAAPSDSRPPKKSGRKVKPKDDGKSGEEKQKHHQFPDPAKWRRIGLASGLSEKFSFENFVVGDSNRLSHAAAVAVAEKPGRTYHPLFIYSTSGLGKTHLLHAIGWEALNLRPKSRVVYISAEQFANEFIDALQKNALVAFRKKYREDTDILLIDDIQFLAGKDGMQEEFFHTFNTLSDSHKQIVLASDSPAQEIQHLEDRLVNRFQWGMTAEIFRPSVETRIAILRRKREEKSISVEDWVIEYIADRISSDVRAMEGAVIRAATIASLNGSQLDEATLEGLIEDFDSEDDLRAVCIDDIQMAAAGKFDVSVREIIGRRRTANVVKARHVAMYLARKLTGLSLAEIGHEFGDRDHGTIHHAVDKISKKMEDDHQLRRLVEILRRQLCSGAKDRRTSKGRSGGRRGSSWRNQRSSGQSGSGDSLRGEVPEDSELE